MSRIVGILLAAGASRRFGGDKLIQKLADGELVAVKACRNLVAGTDEVLAVLRSGDDLLASQLRQAGARVKFCPSADQGMGASLAFGVRAYPEASGWLIALADMPWITPASIRSVADALRAGAAIAAPYLNGQRGHPVGFARSLGAELAALDGDNGAKAVIQAHMHLLRNIACNDGGILQDIDHPHDLQIAIPAKTQ